MAEHPSGNWLHDPVAFMQRELITPEQRIAINSIESGFRALQVQLDAMLPDWLPERDIVAERLVEAAMWARRGIRRASVPKTIREPANGPQRPSPICGKAHGVHDSTCYPN